MSRPKSERFKLLQKIAGRYESLAARDLGVSVGNLAEQKSRLIELQNFREEYTRLFYQSGSGGITSAVMQSFQQFISQIDTAIQQQKQTVNLAEQDRTIKKNEWEGKHRKTQIYNKTVQRFIQDETMKSEQRNESEMDDRNNAHNAKKESLT